MKTYYLPMVTLTFMIILSSCSNDDTMLLDAESVQPHIIATATKDTVGIDQTEIGIADIDVSDSTEVPTEVPDEINEKKKDAPADAELEGTEIPVGI